MPPPLIPFAILAAALALVATLLALVPLGDWLQDRVGPRMAAFYVIGVFGLVVASVVSVALSFL